MDLFGSAMHIACFHVVCMLLVSDVYFSVILFLLLCIFGGKAHLLFVEMLDLFVAGCCESGFDESK